LKNYIYIRQLKKGESTPFKAILGTMIFSAFWHGFMPVYYFFFFFLAVITTVAKDLAKMRPLIDKIIPNQYVVILLEHIFVKFLMGFMISHHFALTLDKVYKIN
jgi:hypothetical protein